MGLYTLMNQLERWDVCGDDDEETRAFVFGRAFDSFSAMAFIAVPPEKRTIFIELGLVAFSPLLACPPLASPSSR